MGKIDSFIQRRLLRPIRLKAIIKILNSLPGGTILDIGCMDNYLLKRLPKKFDYLGIDDSPLCNPTDKIKKMRIEELPENKKFDIVVCTEVLEHIDDPVAGMRKLKELSKRFILTSVPNEPFFSIQRLFLPAKEHLWTIFPWALDRHLGKPVFRARVCFRRTLVSLYDSKTTEFNSINL